ncbi:hypothetical protein AC579_4465 [Pseudocercospora musae]|uniref:Uncharacterized protein n=1 Tax=Pseudocercospora musae TaxID=113226 RepID=A0A139GZ79_9PEZI|nr:hypothetical protein AC579_4465 [Pseudocercospora musae]
MQGQKGSAICRPPTLCAISLCLGFACSRLESDTAVLRVGVSLQRTYIPPILDPSYSENRMKCDPSGAELAASNEEIKHCFYLTARPSRREDLPSKIWI